MVARDFSLYRTRHLVAVDDSVWLNISLPSITNFRVLYARDLGIVNFGTFFIVLGITSLLGRPLLGRLSDKFGRDRSIAAGFVLQLTALLLITTVANLFGMIIAARYT